MKRHADHVAEWLKQRGVTSVGWGDGDLLGNIPSENFRFRTTPDHPLNRMRAVAASMDRATDLFEKRYRRSMNARGAEVVVRCWKLKGGNDAMA